MELSSDRNISGRSKKVENERRKNVTKTTRKNNNFEIDEKFNSEVTRTIRFVQGQSDCCAVH